MQKILTLLIILALGAGFIKLAVVDARPVLAAENPFGDAGTDTPPNLQQIQFITNDNTNQAPAPALNTNQAPAVTPSPETPAVSAVDSGLVVSNTASFQIAKDEVKLGKKYKEFNNQFVFQIDKDTFSADANLELKELALGPNSLLAAPEGFQFASRIYEYNLTSVSDLNPAQPFWLSVRYLDDDYFHKTLYYFDEQNNKWVGMESIISNTVRKIISKTKMMHAKVAILDNLNIMTTGIASWYKYKGCNCAASPDYPKGTKLKVTNVDNGKSIVVKVNDWGPDRSVFPNRVIDLDKVAFRKIAPKSAGLCKVTVSLYQPNVALNK